MVIKRSSPAAAGQGPRRVVYTARGHLPLSGTPRRPTRAGRRKTWARKYPQPPWLTETKFPRGYTVLSCTS